MRGTIPPSTRVLRLVSPLGCLAACLPLFLLAGCGGGDGPGIPPLGTVALVNQTDQGQAPLVVDEFYLAPVGEVDPGQNLLAQSVQPGGLVIIGLFPPGTYNAVAVLEGGSQINFPPMAVVQDQPTNFVIPGQ